MRVAALYDIHGNLPALEAVLAEVESAAVDVVVVGGDVVSGPFPAATLELLLGLGGRVRFLRGNADRLEAEPDWVGAQFDAGRRALITTWPAAVVLEPAGLGAVRFCHGSPRSDEESITPATPDRRLRPMLAGVVESVVVCGHTHMQFDRVAGRHRVVNAGSVGMPYEGRRGAYWALLGPGVELRRTAYDAVRAAARIRSDGHPEAAPAFAELVLRPPTRAEATAAFEPA
ncbi:MAG TPA: metallophosphoesterase family protein [Gaiellales bacterium]|nr:metallophosphoesterase family protein [Gaiellales bacterium]